MPVANPQERSNREVKRRADGVGIFPDEESIVRPIGAVLPEANDERQLQNRCRQTRAMAELSTRRPSTIPPSSPPTKAARPWLPRPNQRATPR